MSRPGYFPGDYYVDGELSAKSMAIPTGSIDETHLRAGAKLPATKHITRVMRTHGQNGTAAAQTIGVHKAYASGSILEFAGGAIVPAIGAATVTIDLKKNGVSVLTTPLVLTNSNTANVAVVAALPATTYAPGDLIAVYQTVSASTGTLPTGTFFSFVAEENPT